MADNEVKKTRKTNSYWLKEILSNGTDAQKKVLIDLINDYKNGLELIELKKQRDSLDAKIKKLESK